MKNFFYLALAAITITLASCGDKDNNPENKLFTIQIDYIADDYAEAIITPSDDNIEWTYRFFKTSNLQGDNLKAYITAFNIENGYTYAKLKEQDSIFHAEYNIYTYLNTGTEYTLCVFQVDKELNIVGDVYSKTFYTLPAGFRDLGLPSGKLWSYEPVAPSNIYLMLSDYQQQLPTQEDWQELIDNCVFYWNNYYDRFQATGPNKRPIYFDPTVSGQNKAYYWSRSGSAMNKYVLQLEQDKDPLITTRYHDSKAGVMQVIPNPHPLIP